MNLDLRGDAGNLRHYLDGRDIHCGQQLRLRVVSPPRETWVWARYEARPSRDGQSLFVTLFTNFGMVTIDEETVLRWPEEGER